MNFVFKIAPRVVIIGVIVEHFRDYTEEYEN